MPPLPAPPEPEAPAVPVTPPLAVAPPEPRGPAPPLPADAGAAAQPAKTIKAESAKPRHAVRGRSIGALSMATPARAQSGPLHGGRMLLQHGRLEVAISAIGKQRDDHARS